MTTTNVTITETPVTVTLSTTGPQGATGEGVPAGGTAGQYLRKSSATDYDTAFDTITSSDVNGLDAQLAGKTDDADLPYGDEFTGAFLPTTNVALTQAYSSTALFNVIVMTAATSGCYLEYTVFVAAGTYTLRTLYRKNTDYGIVSVSIDGGAALGTTIDGYASTLTANNITDITGIALTAGRHTIRFTSTTKNASSTGYRIALHGMSIVRTGA